jgi:7-dehydrocholesterol reductase
MQAPATVAARAWSQPRHGRVVGILRTTVLPLLLVAVTPAAVILLWTVSTFLDASLARLLTPAGWSVVVHHLPRPSWTAVEILGVFGAFELLLLLALPGPVREGAITPSGQRPRYRLNGVPAWAVTHAAFFVGSYGLGWFSPAIVVDHFGEILVTLTVSVFFFCWILYFKGIFAPSTPDAGPSGNVILDYFWGVELHPSVLGVDLKQLFNCRISMMGWSLVVISCAARQQLDTGTISTSMLVSVVLQVAYLFKFFCWEGGYFSTLDIMHDRFGYYICWGVLAWVPGVYTLTARYLVNHPRDLGLPATIALLAIGFAALWANYAADAQRQRVRRTEGRTTVWGRPPALIRAQYTTADGESHSSLLLVSGFWGLARHFHYVPELVLAAAWSLPAGFDRFLPYFYLMFLTILLVDRAGRDDARCRAKYGVYWDAYCERVPYRILPGVY